MEEVELSPLVGREGAEEGVIEQLAAAKARFALGDNRVHGGDGFGGLGFDLLRGQAARDGVFGSLAAFGEIVEGQDKDGLKAVLERGLGAQRATGLGNQ